MPKPPCNLPIVSHELEFVAKYEDEVNSICEGTHKVTEAIQQLTISVANKATQNARELLDQLKPELGREIRGLLRIKWQRFSSANWQIYGALYSARGPMKKIGSAGFNVGFSQDFHVIGWARSFGGLNGLERLAQACSRKNPDVHVASEKATRFPGWIGGEDAVIWLDQKLAVKTSFQELQVELRKRAKPFFRTARPLMRELAP
jgi:hypothetical protein